MNDKSIHPIIITATASGWSEPPPKSIDNLVSVRSRVKRSMELHPITLEIPDEYLVWIGRIITYWAYAEWFLVEPVCSLLDINRKDARQLFTTGRIKDLFKKIKDALRDKQINVPSSDLTSHYAECKTSRDLLGHSVWIREENTKKLCVQCASGKSKGAGINRREYPEVLPIDIKWFEQTFEKIKQAIAIAREFDKQIQSELKKVSPRE